MKVKKIHRTATPAPPGFCRLAEAASMLGVSRDTVLRLEKAGKFSGVRTSPRTLFYRRDDLVRYLHACGGSPLPASDRFARSMASQTPAAVKGAGAGT